MSCHAVDIIIIVFLRAYTTHQIPLQLPGLSSILPLSLSVIRVLCSPLCPISCLERLD
jgi:hypothetical protein